MTTSWFIGRIEKMSDVRGTRLTNQKSPQGDHEFVCQVQTTSMNDVVLGAAFKGLDGPSLSISASHGRGR